MMDTQFFVATVAAGLIGWLGVSFGSTSNPAEGANGTVVESHADSHRRGALVTEAVALPAWSERVQVEEEPVLLLAASGE